jgi:microcystin-dependent protein
MPSHIHDYQIRFDDDGNGGDGAGGSPNNTTTTNQTASTGGDQAHENRPSFYALAYIYKL